EGGPHPVELPLGQVPSHGDDDGPDLPSGEGGEDVLRRVAQLDDEAVAQTQPPAGKDAGELGRPLVELTPAELSLGSVLGQEDQAVLVAPFLTQLVDAGAVGDERHFAAHEE